MKYRPHRGLFRDSMAEMVEVPDFQALAAIIAPVVIVRTEWQCFDARAGWGDDSYLLIGEWPDAEVGPVGYVSKRMESW